jgi:hypothetical protein
MVAFKGLSLLKNSLAIGKYYDDQYSGEYAQEIRDRLDPADRRSRSATSTSATT